MAAEIMGYSFNITEPLDLFDLANNLTGGNLFLIFVIVVWFISFGTFSRIIGIRSLPISFFVTLTLSMLFYWLGFVSIVPVGISLSGLVITAFLSLILEGRE